MKKVLFCLVLCLVALPVLADTIVIGNPPDPGSGNSFPFGTAYNAEYQQVYSSSRTCICTTPSSTAAPPRRPLETIPSTYRQLRLALVR